MHWREADGLGCVEEKVVSRQGPIQLHGVRELSGRNDPTAADHFLERVTENERRIRLELTEFDRSFGIKRTDRRSNRDQGRLSGGLRGCLRRRGCGGTCNRSGDGSLNALGNEGR